MSDPINTAAAAVKAAASAEVAKVSSVAQAEVAAAQAAGVADVAKAQGWLRRNVWGLIAAVAVLGIIAFWLIVR